jgi:guanylate kinase
MEKKDKGHCYFGNLHYHTNDASTYQLLRQNAKYNRKHPTEAEALLWEYLRGKQLGVRFRRQHPVYDYIPDFVCLTLNLIIEVDGDYHLAEEQKLSDEKRDAYLMAFGFHIIRFTNEEVLHNLNNVLNKIKTAMNKLSSENQSANTTPTAKIQEDISNFTSSPNISQDCPLGTPLPRRGGGRLLILSAPSGAGKSTIVQWLMKEHPELKLAFSISCTTRAPRGTEQNGVEYIFLSPEEFKEKIHNGEFLEFEEVYENRFYGTLKSQVESQVEAGQNVVFDVDVKGGCNIKKFYGERALSLFIQPPSVEELRRRLVGRQTDSAEAIENRLAKASYELTFAKNFDRVIVNDDLEKAKQETYEIVKTFLEG